MQNQEFTRILEFLTAIKCKDFEFIPSGMQFAFCVDYRQYWSSYSMAEPKCWDFWALTIWTWYPAGACRSWCGCQLHWPWRCRAVWRQNNVSHPRPCDQGESSLGERHLLLWRADIYHPERRHRGNPLLFKDTLAWHLGQRPEAPLFACLQACKMSPDCS